MSPCSKSNEEPRPTSYSFAGTGMVKPLLTGVVRNLASRTLTKVSHESGAGVSVGRGPTEIARAVRDVLEAQRHANNLLQARAPHHADGHE